jgi:hypothetical protein
MKDRSRAGWRRTSTCMAVALAGTVGMFLAQSEASATDSLSAIIVSNALPGMVQTPAGPLNGPINQSNLQSFGGSSGALGQAMASGAVTGYLRSWTHEPVDGDVAVIGAFQFQDASDMGSVLAGMNSANGAQGSSTFAVPGITGGLGSVSHTTASGIPVTVYIVTFAKGAIAFDVTLESTSGDLTSADALALADSQFASAPGATVTPSSNWATQVGAVVGVALVAIFVVGLIVILVQRGRRRSATLAPSPLSTAYLPPPPTGARPAGVSYPPPPTESLSPGWTTVGETNSVQWHWDGTAWTGRRQLTPAGWVEG